MTGPREHAPVATGLSFFLSDLETLARSTLAEATCLTIVNRCGAARYMLDAGMLQDSLLNLVINARDACGPDGRITLTVQEIGETWLEFIVADSGPGFSDLALARALDPFFTTKGGEGSGLGLSMVYDMTKLAGGRIILGNGDAGGRVCLRLPLRRPDAIRTPGLVLLVEDSPDLRGTIRDMLREAGHAVVEAAGADEALGLLPQLPEISVLLSDISLEGERNGLDLIDGLPEGHCPAYLMTSLPPENPLHAAARARAPVLRKPFTAAELSAFLTTAGASR